MRCKTPHIPPPRGEICPRIDCLSKMMRQTFNEALAEQGLFSGQQEILFVLMHCPGITPGELSVKLNIAPATASKSVKRMEKNGYIIKKPDKDDARITRLFPSQKALAAPKCIRAKMNALETVLKKDMTDGEVNMLSDLLERAINNLKEGADVND